MTAIVYNFVSLKIIWCSVLDQRCAAKRAEWSIISSICGGVKKKILVSLWGFLFLPSLLLRLIKMNAQLLFMFTCNCANSN